MSNTPPPSQVQSQCDKCGDGLGLRNHAVLAEHIEQQDDPHSHYWWHSEYQIIKCLGCDTVRFRLLASEDGVPEGASQTFPRPSVAPYGTDMDLANLPAVGPIYRETVNAMLQELPILAAGGIRACVEAICKEKGVKAGNLEKKIDALAEQSLLTIGQVQLLHACRFMGNTALHELKAPTMEDNRLALGIVESLMRTIYIYPLRAKELEARHGPIKDQQ